MDGLVGDEYDGRELPFCRDGVKHPLNSLLCDSGRSDSIASPLRQTRRLTDRVARCQSSSSAPRWLVD